MEDKNTTIFFDKLNQHIRDKTLIKLVLSNQRDHASDVKSILISLVVIKKGIRLNFVYRHKTKDITKNHDIGEALALVKKSLEEEFLNADLFSNGETLRLLTTPLGNVKLRSNQPLLKPADSFSHDRLKERIIPTQNNIYLRELGVLNTHFDVRNEMADKYLQINNYIALLAPVIKEINLADEFHVADMGSGKGYLTLALYDYLVNLQGKHPVMTGVETRKDLVNLSNKIAAMAAFTRLTFVTGTIREVEIEKIDILIALHACDTATDDAIFRGIASDAALIVVAPCCHKQVRKEFKVVNEFKSITKHGILEERLAEVLTDGIRALIMEAHGYKTKVVEFISTDHTPKNLMIIGRKLAGPVKGKAKILENIRALKERFGVGEHYLEKLLARDI